ncbi:hypothetical protein ES703_92587 [subsurface metagenome]
MFALESDQVIGLALLAGMIVVSALICHIWKGRGDQK